MPYARRCAICRRYLDPYEDRYSEWKSYYLGVGGPSVNDTRLILWLCHEHGLDAVRGILAARKEAEQA